MKGSYACYRPGQWTTICGAEGERVRQPPLRRRAHLARLPGLHGGRLRDRRARGERDPGRPRPAREPAAPAEEETPTEAEDAAALRHAVDGERSPEPSAARARRCDENRRAARERGHRWASRKCWLKLKLVELEAGRAASLPGAGGADAARARRAARRVPPPRPVDEAALPNGAPRRRAPAAASAARSASSSCPELRRDLPRRRHRRAGARLHRLQGARDPRAPELAALDAKAKAGALAGFLKMNPRGPVPIADIIQDAVRRDQALDQFEEFLRSKLAERAAAVERENAALQAEIDELVRA